MHIPFVKMHGAGNDFILVDDRDGRFPAGDAAWLSRIADRHAGIGCEGIILVQPSATADFRMRFFNPDGNEVEMCGNGARCVARFARRIGAAPEVMSIETIAGELKAELIGDQVRLHMTEPKDWDVSFTLEVEGRTFDCGFVNSGVPHVVAFVDNVDDVDVVKYGAAIRYHERFAPAGTNANFVEVVAGVADPGDEIVAGVADPGMKIVAGVADPGDEVVAGVADPGISRSVGTAEEKPGSATPATEERPGSATPATGAADLRVRTYERGVEGETPACGTGMVASALIAGRRGRAVAPVRVRCAFGEILEVGYTLTEDSATDVTLTGSAVVVFDGTLEYPRPVK